MRKSIKLCGILIFACMLAGCGHEHNWKDATCTEPMICVECGEEQGEPIGHDYKEATCTEPVTCTICGDVQGEPLGHMFTDATCDVAMKCELCGFEKGDALGHLTEFGICDRCGFFQGKELTDKIIGIIDDTNQIGDDLIMHIADNVSASKNDAANFEVIQDAISQYKELISSYEEVIDMCGDIEELASLKKAVQSIIDSLTFPEYPQTTKGIRSFMADLEDYIYTKATAQLEALIIKETIKEYSDKIKEESISPVSEHERNMEIVKYFNDIMDPLNEDMSLSDEYLEEKANSVVNELGAKYHLSFEEIMIIIGDMDLQEEYYSN